MPSAALPIGVGKPWRAIDDLLRTEAVIAFVFSIVTKDDQDIRIRDSAVRIKLAQVARDTTLWDQARALAEVIGPRAKFMGWIQGCNCHEEELLQGEDVQCLLKGCRAKLLATHIETVVADLSKRRETLKPGEFGSVNVEDVKNAISHLLGNIESKFLWVRQPPYLIWQAWLEKPSKLCCVFLCV